MKSDDLFEKSRRLVPGGVHSPVRSFKGLPMAPRFISRAQGAMLYDEDGKNYIDFCMSFGPLILGHRPPSVEKAIIEAVERGWSYGACERYSLELAELIIDRCPGIEQIRFMNSGTEAVMTAVRLARGATGRQKILKFSGCYHGHLDAMLIKAGSGLAGTASASSSGVTVQTIQDTLIADLGDLQQVEEFFQQYPDDIAAIFLEPLPANNGLLPQEQSFLQGLRKLCDRYQALLVFDEVISGFRVAFGGMAEVTGIQPDLLCYGKIIGGGMPVGAVAGPRALMENLAPVGHVYQAGTLSANPVAMAAGRATLLALTPDAYQTMETNTQAIIALFKRWLQDQGHKQFHFSSQASLFWMAPQSPMPRRLSEISSELSAGFLQIFPQLLAKGIYLAPNAYEVSFASLAHDPTVIAELEKRLWS